METLISTARSYLFVVDVYNNNAAIDVGSCVYNHGAVSLGGSDNPWSISGTKDASGKVNFYCEGSGLKVQNLSGTTIQLRVTVLSSI